MMNARANPLGWPTWLWHCLAVFLLAMTAYCVAASLSNLARSAGLLRDLGPPPLTVEQPAGTPIGWFRVVATSPAGKAAGVATGDLVKFGRRLDSMGSTYWPHPVTVERNGARFRTEIVVPKAPVPGAVRGVFALFGIGSLLTGLLAAMLLVRARRNRAAIMLATLLLAYAITTASIAPWAPYPIVAGIGVILQSCITPCIACFKLLFAHEISGGASNAKQVKLIIPTALGFAFLLAAINVAGLIPAPIPVLGAASAAALLVALDNLVLFGIIAYNFRRNDAPARNRIKIVAVALGLYLFATFVSWWLGASPATPQYAAGIVILEVSGLALLAYAVVRQKLFDLNFALNRTLVYAVVSFILLAAFGLAEWGVEHLVPPQWREGGPLFGAGIALALFLSFHRLRDWVEHHVERLLFNSWHVNEAALRRFVAAAGHFNQSPALCRAFAQELSRFAQGTGTALYLRAAGGGYDFAAGKLPGHRKDYTAEDRAFALMRAERGPVDLRETHSSLPGALALPMLDQSALAGFVLLAQKPDGTDYRPDEVEVLGWAAHQVGLALQAQHARELELQVSSLGATLAALTEERDRLEALLTGPKMPPRSRNRPKTAAPV
jgi:hypothetical protein